MHANLNKRFVVVIKVKMSVGWLAYGGKMGKRFADYFPILWEYTKILGNYYLFGY